MTKLATCAAVLAAVLAAGCGKKDEGGGGGPGGHKTDDASSSTDATGGMPTEAQMAKQAEETRKALAQANGGKEIKAVAAADLKALLPATISGAKRSNFESQKISQMGMDIATTKANYDAEPAEGDKVNPGFHVEILDLGNLSGSMSMGYTAWALTTIDKETDTGYEKSTKYKGFPAMEKYDRESKSGEFQVYVAKRFVVQVSGNDATIEQIRGALDAIDIGKLESLVK